MDPRSDHCMVLLLRQTSRATCASVWPNRSVPVDLNVTTAEKRTKALLGPQGQGPISAHSAAGRSQAYQSGPILMRVPFTSMVAPSMMIVLAADAGASISWRNPQITLNYERTPAFQRIVAYCASRAWERC